ncbi:MAG TPA: metallophosphoesterase [Geobacteraceae bacterium]
MDLGRGNGGIGGWARLFALTTLLFLLAVVLPLPSFAEGSGGRGSFLSISDLHFDPYADPALLTRLESAEPAQWKAIFESSQRTGFGAYGHDTPYALLRSTLQAMRLVDPAPDFIIFTGDFLAHDFMELFNKYGRDKSGAAYRRFVEKTVDFLAAEFSASFPATPIVPALGNNDSDCGDYGIEPGGGFLKAFAKAWSPLVGRNGNAASFAETFPVAGYYSVANPALRGRRLVVLNANIFSPKARNCGAAGPGDHGAEELCWLEWTLYQSHLKGEKVWILYHEPVGVDVYASLRGKGECRTNVKMMLKEGYNAALLRIMGNNATIIDASFSGHTHMDDFRLVPGGDSPLLFTHITPSVSPVFGTNPAFQRFVFQRESGAIIDYATYFLKNFQAAKSAGDALWEKEYDYGQAYGQKGYTPATLRSLYGIMAGSAAPRADYMRFYSSGSATGITDENWQAYWCAIGNMTAESFSSCYCRGK